jgi:hypothetical protein
MPPEPKDENPHIIPLSAFLSFSCHRINNCETQIPSYIYPISTSTSTSLSINRLNQVRQASQVPRLEYRDN